ncbi:MAG: hypothetical protein AAGF57_12885, partial [Pseudomonadota bacterium]
NVPLQKGFSLLELLVILMVVVLIFSAVSLSVNSGGKDIILEAQIRNIADVASYAVDEAQIAGRDYGLLLQRDIDEGDTVFRYSWLERQLDGWREPEIGLDVFEPQVLPLGVELGLELDGTPLEDISMVGVEDNPAPQLVFYSSGETMPGALDVRREDDGQILWRLQWDFLGRFEVLPRGIEPEES